MERMYFDGLDFQEMEEDFPPEQWLSHVEDVLDVDLIILEDGLTE